MVVTMPKPKLRLNLKAKRLLLGDIQENPYGEGVSNPYSSKAYTPPALSTFYKNQFGGGGSCVTALFTSACRFFVGFGLSFGVVSGGF